MNDDAKYVKCADLKKRVNYYLTYDYYPHGGLCVRLKKRVKASTLWTGVRGDAAIVVANDGMEFAILPRGCLFAEKPT